MSALARGLGYLMSALARGLGYTRTESKVVTLPSMAIGCSPTPLSSILRQPVAVAKTTNGSLGDGESSTVVNINEEWHKQLKDRHAKVREWSL
ncbi:hypothetical protein M8C21_022860 [Ambrosia artemisiifolia]|uniref:Uncharacterized protein n=1 Tax=Ambrosia artemisiifolia TaxID=4212 RepID=A0AAD5CST2_AMBAR|nr:hypothetical protein M8C21_022860 [Ambrosia artemisiifolia]